MLRPRPTRIRRRISSLLGLPQIHIRLDQLERLTGQEADNWREKVAQLELALGTFDVRLSEQIRVGVLAAVSAAREHSDASVAEHSEHTLKLAALHTEATITAAENLLVVNLRAEIDARADHAVERARDHTGAAIADAVAQAVALVQPELAVLRRRLEALALPTATQPVTSGGSRKQKTRRGAPADIDAAMYAAVEDVFRGGAQMIRERQKAYLPLIKDCVDDEHILIDLGCGRGEWLDLLAAEGIPAKGIDTNPLFVDEARQRGLEIEQDDLVDFLRSAADGTIGAITLFQVLEHLPFPVVVEVISASRRILRPGGVLVAEVPNAKNLRVGAGTFWIDPTHERPWYPDVLEFLARGSGFGDVEGLYLNPVVSDVDVDGVPRHIGALLERIVDAIDGAQDYALVARV